MKAGRGLGRTNRQNAERVWLKGKTGHRGLEGGSRNTNK